MSPIGDRELWACAVAVIWQHGDDAERHVAERIGACAAANDGQGIATWKAIALRIDAIRRPAAS